MLISSDNALKIWRDASQTDQDFVKFRDSVKTWKQANQLKEEGTTLFKAQKWQEACDTYRKAAEVDPYNRAFNASVYMNIGTCITKMGKYKDALKEFNKSIEFNPTYAKAYLKRGNCHEHLEK